MLISMDFFYLKNGTLQLFVKVSPPTFEDTFAHSCKKESGLLFHTRKMKYTTTSDSVFNIKEQPPTHMH